MLLYPFLVFLFSFYYYLINNSMTGKSVMIVKHLTKKEVKVSIFLFLNFFY